MFHKGPRGAEGVLVRGTLCDPQAEWGEHRHSRGRVRRGQGYGAGEKDHDVDVAQSTIEDCVDGQRLTLSVRKPGWPI